MKLKHSIKQEAIEDIEYVPEGSGEAGWLVYLKPGFSFDPFGGDTSCWVPASAPQEAMNLIAYKEGV